MPVHERSVGRLKVTDGDAFARAPDLGVTSRHVGIVDHDLNIGASTDDQRALPHVERTTVVHDQSGLTLAAQEFSLHFEIAGLDVVVDEDFDLDGTHEAEPLADGVLAHGLFKLTHQGLLKALKSCRVDRTEPYADLIRRDGALARQAARQVNFADNARADINCTGDSVQPSAQKLSGESTNVARSRGEWRNWQTRRLQVPVFERMWGFKSPLAHDCDVAEFLGQMNPQMISRDLAW